MNKTDGSTHPEPAQLGEGRVKNVKTKDKRSGMRVFFIERG